MVTPAALDLVRVEIDSILEIPNRADWPADERTRYERLCARERLLLRNEAQEAQSVAAHLWRRRLG